MPVTRQAIAVIGALATLVATAGSAEAALWTFRGSGGISYEFSVSNADGDSQQSGVLSGGFDWDPDGSLSNINVKASNVAFCGVNCWADKNATQNDFGGEVEIENGYITPLSGNVRTLYLWNFYGEGQQRYARGLQLTFNEQNINGNIILSVASTSNDNFCKDITFTNEIPNRIPTGCTTAKNNLTNVSGTLETPSPAAGLGLLPIGLLAWRRRQSRQRGPIGTAG